MTAHPIPATADLVDLVALSKRWDEEDALERLKAELAAVWPVRRAKRALRSRAAHKGAVTKHQRAMAALRIIRPMGEKR